MKKTLSHLLLSFMLCAAVACGGSTQDQEEGKSPVSADDPKAPTTAPDKPTTDIGEGLEDSAATIEQSQDSL
ncbi:hypothetical protein POKO110462_13625 [Pontibacter korlensis]|uniref:Uncharacterized protein n=1 Tax=Pontibacter korlensis TaxID=400092 RepID=A0A0E3UZG1_9BACT|nr:hypothetical protein [Pontibacter korlensis]AKD05301.1 hypothetical protein PKOR_22340 [Pontibacter korlensis]